MIPRTETEILPLLLDPNGPRVTVIGGGHGQAAALEAIQSYASRISALVSVADDGGSSGRLRGMGIPAPGDVRRCLLALTPEPTLWTELFAHRFRDGDVADHSLGNLILAGLADILGDFETAVDTASRMMNALGAVIPVTSIPVTLAALVAGEWVEGQSNVAKARGEIEALRLEPSDVPVSARALAAIAEADQIVLGPGSLYTSLIAALLVPMLSDAVAAATSQRVFVLNLVTQDGETLGATGGQHLQALRSHAGLAGPGVVVAHDGPLEAPPGLTPVEVDDDEAAELGWRVVRSDVADETAPWPAHDPIKLGTVLETLLPSS